MSFSTALSITAHESPITLIDQCLNNVLVGQFDAIAIHINAHADFDTALLARLIEATPPLRSVVHINPQRLPTDWVAPGLLHRAHIANFHLLRSKLAFDVFCTDGSNTLLIGTGLKAHLERQQLGVDTSSAFGWGSAWEDNLRQDLLFQRCGEACRRNQIEGMFMPTELFARAAQWIEDYETTFTTACAQGQEPIKYPREEYLFSTALDQLGVPLKDTPYILMRQGSGLCVTIFSTDGQPTVISAVGPGRAFSWEPFEINASLQAGRLTPLYWELIADHVPPIQNVATYRAGKFGVKRVGRSIDDPIRQSVSHHFGYRQMVLNSNALC